MNNLELIKLAYESFGKGDMETFSSLYQISMSLKCQVISNMQVFSMEQKI